MTFESKANLVVLVSGRGTNLQALIDAQASGKMRSRIQCVIANRADAQALDRAHKAGIPTRVIVSKGRSAVDYNRELKATLLELNPQWIVLAGYMKILPPDIVDAFVGRMINIHPSLLPAFPGLHAQQQALDAGVKITGCTVHYVDGGCDTGPIIVQKAVAVLPDDDADSLAQRLLKVEHEALIEAVTILES